MIEKLDAPRLMCRDCRWKIENVCRRLDWETLVPAHSPVVSANSGHTSICADFAPAKHWAWLSKNWASGAPDAMFPMGFDSWYAIALRQWGVLTAREARQEDVGIVLVGDDSGDAYYMPRARWLFGKPVQGGVLRVDYVVRHRRFRWGDRQPPKIERIDGLEVDAPDSTGGDRDV